MSIELVVSMLNECLEGEMEGYVRSNIQRSIGILEQITEDDDDENQDEDREVG